MNNGLFLYIRRDSGGVVIDKADYGAVVAAAACHRHMEEEK